MNRNQDAPLGRGALVIGAAASAAGLTALPAHAQDQDQSAGAQEQTVIVTGTRIRRVDQETASPVFVMDQSAIESSGAARVT